MPGFPPPPLATVLEQPAPSHHVDLGGVHVVGARMSVETRADLMEIVSV
jgi:hypothetical protein